MTTRTAQIGSRIDSLKDSVKDLVDVGTDRAASIKDATVSTATKLASQTARLVKKHPIAAVAIAFGVGYIAMRLVRR
ncbi:MAG TPA: hypothetical protein VGO00_11595 [Kofleriaceae bacterium]|jgi:ElaB/YqjD/DUF883 family membrane-anchored ribosome-binding protein|nr:hypothetical protein [Kofleriaceae bacterium]